MIRKRRPRTRPIDDQRYSTRPVDAPMSLPLITLDIPTEEQLRADAAHWIDQAVAPGAVDDANRDLLDDWFDTRKTSALTALRELIDQQRRVDDALVDEASEHHHRAHTEHSALDTQAIAHRSRAAEVRCHTLRPDEHSDSSPTM